MDRKLDRPSILEANYFYLVIGIVLLFLGSIVQQREVYSGLIITEYLIILMPTILYLKIRGYSLKRVLRLNKLSPLQILLIPIIVLLLYPTGAFLNSIMMIILSLFGEIKALPIPIPETGVEFLINFLVVAVSAGICEEVMFRGMIMKAYEGLNIKKSIAISAVLFGFFHFNIQNLLGPIFLGVLFGYLVYKTNSLFASMLAHLTNNTIAIVLSFLIGKLGEQTEPASEITSNMSYTFIMAIGALSIGFIAIFTGTLAFLLLKILPKSEDSVFYTANLREIQLNKERVGVITILPLIIVGIIFTIISVIRIIGM